MLIVHWTHDGMCVPFFYIGLSFTQTSTRIYLFWLISLRKLIVFKIVENIEIVLTELLLIFYEFQLSKKQVKQQ